MTYALSLTNLTGTMTVDLMSVDADVTFSVSNPAIADFSTPTVDIPITGVPIFNVYTINIGFLEPTALITFTESSGLGSIFNTTRTTSFEKLFYLAYFDKGHKLLYMNDGSSIPVQITFYRARCKSGKKDIVEHTLQLMITNTESA